MKYFQVTGKSRDEVGKKILKDYGGKAFILKLSKETKTITGDKKWYYLGVLKPKIYTEYYYKAYCSLPENIEDFGTLKDLKSPTKKTYSPVSSYDTNYEDTQLELSSSSLVNLNHTPEQKIDQVMISDDIQIKADISHLKDIVSNLYKQTKENGSKHKLLPYLLEKGFSYKFSIDFLDSLQTEVEDTKILKIILQEKLRLKIFFQNYFNFSKGESYLFLGSTGVGKTTTIAKMAAICYNQGLSNFKFVSFDSYRIGADEQLKRFADIFEKPFYLIQNEEDMEQFIQKIKKTDILFLDSAGESIKQEIKIPEILKYISYIKNPIKIFLVISAHSKIDDLYAIKKQFEKFIIEGYIITKIDETKTLGSIVEFLYSEDTKAIFYTDGQAVPNDIKFVSYEDFFHYI